MGAFRARRDRRAGGDHRHRGRRRRPERDGDDRRGRGPLRALAAPPAPRACRPRRRRIVVLPVRRPETPDGTARMEAMEESTDGFVLAERDLEIRGSGQVFGERQAGLRRPEARPAATRRELRGVRPHHSRNASSTTIPAWRATARSPRRSRTCWVRTSSSSSRAEEDTMARRFAAPDGGRALVIGATRCGSDGSKPSGALDVDDDVTGTPRRPRTATGDGATDWSDVTAHGRQLAPDPFAVGPQRSPTTSRRSAGVRTRPRSAS